MRIKLSELRNIVRSVIVESSQLPSRWYHGSPYGGMQSASDFKGPIMFLSDSEQVASQYKKQLIGTGRKPTDDVQDGPVILHGNSQVHGRRSFRYTLSSVRKHGWLIPRIRRSGRVI